MAVRDPNGANKITANVLRRRSERTFNPTMDIAGRWKRLNLSGEFTPTVNGSVQLQSSAFPCKAHNHRMRLASGRGLLVTHIAFFFVFIVAASAQQPSQLEITTTALDSCVVDDPCTLPIRASGGAAPLKWEVTHGSLPPGLQLDPAHGIIGGAPTVAGDREVTVEVSDASEPPQKASRVFHIRTIPALEVDWKKPPALSVTTVFGSVKVSNNSSNVVDLTVIIVAVNEIGKAFALGYQHFNLAPKTLEQEIPFESQLPGGRYTLRVDAIGEVPAKNRIYRAAREAGPIQVPIQ